MSVQQAIHEHWSAYRPLDDLVPANRVYTGLVPPVDAAGGAVTLPYVSLTTQGDRGAQRTSSGTVLTSVQLRFSVFGGKYSETKEVAAAILAHFNRAEFNWSRGKVLDMKQIHQAETEADDGTWQIALDYLARVLQTGRQ